MPAKNKAKNYDFLPAHIPKGYRVNGFLVCEDTGFAILWGELEGLGELKSLS